MTDELIADLLTAVEQQLTSPETPYVAETFARLRGLGLTDAAAKKQIAFALAEQMDLIIETKKPFDQSSYRALLNELPYDEMTPELE